MNYDEAVQRRQMEIATYRRMGPFLIGLCLGYTMYMNKTNRMILSRLWQTIGWIICFVIMAILAYAPQGLNSLERGARETVWNGAFFKALSRNIWALAISWIIFVSNNGNGGIVNYFLSLRVWQPIARISYSLYVIHHIVIVILYARIRTPFYFSMVSVVSRYFSYLW